MLIPILIKLRLKAFWVLSGSGFLLGYVLQWLFSLRGRPKYESLVVHLITSVLWIILFVEVYLNLLNEKSQRELKFSKHRLDDHKDLLLYFVLCYLFIIGTVAGLVSEII